MRPAIVDGIALGTRQSAISQFFSPSLVTVSENFAKANSGHLIVSKVAKKLSYLILNATVTKNNATASLKTGIVMGVLWPLRINLRSGSIFVSLCK